MPEKEPGWIEKTGKDSPTTLLIVGVAIGFALMFLIGKFMAKK